MWAMGELAAARQESREDMRDGQYRGMRDRRCYQWQKLQKAKHTPHSVHSVELWSPKS